MSMDIYNVWFDLKPGTSDVKFVEHAQAYLGHLVSAGKIQGFRIMRRKLGLGPPGLGEFHVAIEVTGLAELDAAFQHVATRAGPVEGLHASVNQLVQNASFALYRDFPDPFRERGQEKF
jgi:hypothetical protein